jgi:hypothetical protein
MMNYQDAKVISIVNKEILARIESVKRKQELSTVKHDKRDWVHVPYEQKDEAKRYGCRWCPIEKRWYASSYMNSKLVELNLEESRTKKLKLKRK